MNRRQLLLGTIGLGFNRALQPYMKLTERFTLPPELLTHSEWLEKIQKEAQRTDFDLTQTKKSYLSILHQQRKSIDWIIPSPNYKEMYTRDTVLNLLADPDIVLIKNCVTRFLKHQSPTGQIPTYINTDENPYFNDDESTIFFLLLVGLTPQSFNKEYSQTIAKSVNYVVKKVADDNSYQTSGSTPTAPVTRYHYWIDSVQLPTPASPAFVQGLAVCALESTQRRELFNINPLFLKQLLERYRLNFVSGFPAMGVGSTVWDVSALAPDALSLLLNNQPLLSQREVIRSFNALVRKTSCYYEDGSFLGFKILSEQGNYLAPEQFSPGVELNPPGRYQNGGSWTLWDALVLYSAGRHGSEKAVSLFISRLKSDFKNKQSISNEFLATTGSQSIVTGRNNYGWNGLIARLM